MELTPPEVTIIVDFLREYGQLDREEVDPKQRTVLEKLGYFPPVVHDTVEPKQGKVGATPTR